MRDRSRAFGATAGHALARLEFPWAAPLGTVTFITYVPPTLLFIPLGDVVKTFGIGDTPWAVMRPPGCPP